jgi:hypothetical protein
MKTIVTYGAENLEVYYQKTPRALCATSTKMEAISGDGLVIQTEDNETVGQNADEFLTSEH